VRASCASPGAFLLLGLGLLPTCGDTPENGLQLEVVNGAEAAMPASLRMDWFDGDREIFRDRRVPEKGVLAPPLDATLATVRIALQAGATGERRAVVRGMSAAEEIVSEGTASHPVKAGWWTFTLTLAARLPGERPDGGEAMDAAADRSGGSPEDAGTGPDAPDAGMQHDVGADGPDDEPTDAAPDGGAPDGVRLDGARIDGRQVTIDVRG
jgi:hypothetical protein